MRKGAELAYFVIVHGSLEAVDRVGMSKTTILFAVGHC